MQSNLLLITPPPCPLNICAMTFGALGIQRVRPWGKENIVDFLFFGGGGIDYTRWCCIRWSCVGQLNPLWTHSSWYLENDTLCWSLLRAGAIPILSSNIMHNYIYLTGVVLVEGYSSCCTLYGFIQSPCTVFHSLNTSAYSSALKKQRSIRMEG